MAIDGTHAKSNRLIWRGSLAHAVTSPQDADKMAVKAVREILIEFPLAAQRKPVD